MPGEEQAKTESRTVGLEFMNSINIDIVNGSTGKKKVKRRACIAGEVGSVRRYLMKTLVMWIVLTFRRSNHDVE